MKKESGLLGRLILTIALIIGLYLLLISPLLRMRDNSIDERLARASIELRHFLQAKSPLPSLENYQLLDKEMKTLNDNYAELSNSVVASSPYLPKGVTEAGLYFIERLHSISKKLSAKATEAGIEMPSDFGFSEELPEAAKVEFCLRQLDIVDKVVSSFIERGAAAITLIKPLKFEKGDSKKEGPDFEMIEVQFSARSSNEALIRFLIDMRNAKPTIVVKNLQIVSEASGLLRADLVVSGLLLN